MPGLGVPIFHTVKKSETLYITCIWPPIYMVGLPRCCSDKGIHLPMQET